MSEELKRGILSAAKDVRIPSGVSLNALSLSQRDALSARFRITKLELELAALDNAVVPQRYLRNIGTIGIEGQKQLLRAAALVVGLGGLGGVLLRCLPGLAWEN